jgi:hypothetical protein
MRDIKFRGKRIDNGDWVYGYYYKGALQNMDCKVNYVILSDGVKWHVIPETVGQYTSRKDKNCKEIYEGDATEEGIVVFSDDYLGFFVKLFKPEYEQQTNSLYDIPLPEIIGNIHDNPELLEEIM